MDDLKTATEIAKKIQSHGYICYFAGGWVRDFIMDHPSDDIDLVTDAPIEWVQQTFSKIIPVGISFGILIIVENNHQFELAIFRKEDLYTDGRRPDKIEKASPMEDAKRRDFTINGLFYDPIKKKILDYVEGKKDIRAKIIRAIGDPHKRFLEDRLRMIRAVRYSARFHFTIEQNTYNAIKAHAHQLFPSVAIERIVNEFEKMAKFPNFTRAIEQLWDLGLLGQIFPSLLKVDRAQFHPHLSLIESFPSNTPLILKLIHLFPNYHLDEKLHLCKKLKVSNIDTSLVQYQHRCEAFLSRPIHEIEDYDLAKEYAEPNFFLCLSIFLTKQPDESRQLQSQFHEHKNQELKRYVEMFRKNDLIIRANDLLIRGIKPGPKIGQLIEKGNRFAINQRIESKELILAHIL